jgi:uncharacterized membrane protein YeaQ/YmgE (transglycosylase-associated protein family)
MGGFIEDIWFYTCGWIIVGGIAGGVARYIMRSADRPFLNDLLLGIAGALLGGFVVSAVGYSDDLDIGLGIGTIITAIIGAMILIAVGRLLFGKRR